MHSGILSPLLVSEPEGRRKAKGLVIRLALDLFLYLNSVIEAVSLGVVKYLNSVEKISTTSRLLSPLTITSYNHHHQQSSYLTFVTSTSNHSTLR